MKLVNLDVKRVPLPRAPLVLVLCQLRFNAQPELGIRATAEAVLEELAPAYVDLQEQTVDEATFELGAPGFEVRRQSGKNFLLKNPAHSWWILLSPSVATLVSPSYSERKDFTDRIAALRGALSEVAGVKAITRVGVRYVSRVADDDFLADLSRYVHPRVLGATDLPLADGADLGQTLSDTLVHRGNTTARVRAGLVPAGLSPDPAVTPLQKKSWLFDVDMFDADYRAADEGVEQAAAELARTQYQLFRWLVTDEFLRYFGGDI